MKKRALITGITGQDGSYLAEFLLEKDYQVYGVVRRVSDTVHSRISHLTGLIQLVQGDLSDQSSLDEAVLNIQPDEVYNLASQSFVPTSWNQPVLTGDTTGMGVTRVLEAVRKYKSDAKFYQASSSEMFGKATETPQNELTRFYPRSPYGVAKVYAHYLTINYRESYNLFACCGILFNHESPRRGLEFVTRKISDGAARIKLGLSRELKLGNIEAKRDWGFAKDYVKAMWLMLQQPKPDDYVVSTDENHSIQEFLEIGFRHLGLDWREFVKHDPGFERPAEVDQLVGDSSKARRILGWKPEVDFEHLVKMMVDADLARHRVAMVKR